MTVEFKIPFLQTPNPNGHLCRERSCHLQNAHSAGMSIVLSAHVCKYMNFSGAYCYSAHFVNWAEWNQASDSRTQLLSHSIKTSEPWSALATNSLRCWCFLRSLAYLGGEDFGVDCVEARLNLIYSNECCFTEHPWVWNWRFLSGRVVPTEHIWEDNNSERLRQAFLNLENGTFS